MDSVNCFRCGKPGHWANMCPLISMASSFEEHIARIQSFIDRWAGGAMTRQEKRVSISLENELWYGENCPRRLRYP